MSAQVWQTGPAGDLCSAERAPRLRGEEKNQHQMPQCVQESSPTLPAAPQGTTDHRQKVFSWLPFKNFYIFVQISKQKSLSLYYYAFFHVWTSFCHSFLQRLDAPTETCICLLTFSGQHLFCQALMWYLRYTKDKYHCTHGYNQRQGFWPKRAAERSVRAVFKLQNIIPRQAKAVLCNIFNLIFQFQHKTKG